MDDDAYPRASTTPTPVRSETSPMALTLYDTLTREERAFEPREEGRVSMYVCGPTVYAEAHIGHGRASVVFDLLRRHLTWSGYEVTHVTNITDVDDKIILRAARERSSPAAVATTYTHAWNRSMERVGVLPPTIQPFATGHLLQMHELMRTLIDRDMAYESDGNVLFRVRKFDDYGRLSGRDPDEMVSQDDVVGAEVKDDPLDFTMWKAAKPGEPSWPSPWGPGRPGWHIECSAMAAAHLGGGFDIHGGGFDLVFPHHENEAAQHEAAHGGRFTRYWVHNGMVRMGEEKMSKSIGNIVSLDDAVTRWGRGPLRLWYLSAHHRSPLTYDESRLVDGTAAFDRFVTFVRSAELAVGRDTVAAADARSEVTTAHVEEFRAALDDDLNAPRAVAALHQLAAAGSELVPAAEDGDDRAVADVASLAALLVELADDVLGLGIEPVLAEGRRANARVAPLVDAAVARRAEARAARDFETADRIRDELADAAIVLEDRPGGARWYVDPASLRDGGGPGAGDEQ